MRAVLEYKKCAHRAVLRTNCATRNFAYSNTLCEMRRGNGKMLLKRSFFILLLPFGLSCMDKVYCGAEEANARFCRRLVQPDAFGYAQPYVAAGFRENGFFIGKMHRQLETVEFRSSYITVLDTNGLHLCYVVDGELLAEFECTREKGRLGEKIIYRSVLVID